MKTVVIYKWARDPEDAAVRSDGSVDWRGAKRAAGEDDPAVIAAGRAIAEAAGGTLVGLTIGDGDASWALARGVAETVSVPDAPNLADTMATAGVLAAAIRSIGEVDVVVIGDAEAYPGVAAGVAAGLGWPVVLGVTSATFDGGRLVARAPRGRRRADDEPRPPGRPRCRRHLGREAGAGDEGGPGGAQASCHRRAARHPGDRRRSTGSSPVPRASPRSARRASSKVTRRPPPGSSSPRCARTGSCDRGRGRGSSRRDERDDRRRMGSRTKAINRPVNRVVFGRSVSFMR